MISSDLLFFLKDEIQNEFRAEVKIFDGFGTLLATSSTSGFTETLNVSTISSYETTILPIYDGLEVCYYFKFATKLPSHIISAVRSMINTAIKFERKDMRFDRVSREETILVSRMLSSDASIYHNDILASGINLGYKLEHPMAMIVTFLDPSYNYCLNMDLGYEGATDAAKKSILEQIKNHMYMNRQDLIAFVQNNCLIVLKALEELNDLPQVYRMISTVAEAINDELKSYRIFRYFIAPGVIIKNFDLAHQAYQESMEYILFARNMNLDHPIITQDDILFYAITARLPDQLRTETIEPKVQLLLEQDPEVLESIVQCFDSYIDHNFSISETAADVYLHRNTVRKKLEKLHNITGYDPAGCFRDILINKLILQQYLIATREQ